MVETFTPPKTTSPKNPQIRTANLGSPDELSQNIDPKKIAAEPKLAGAGVGKSGQKDDTQKKAVTDTSNADIELTQLQVALKEYAGKLKNAKNNAEVAITILKCELKKLSKHIKREMKSGLKSEVLHEFVELLNQTKALFNTK